MIHYIIAQFINSIVLVLLGILVYFNNKKNIVNITYALHSFAAATWSFAFYKMCIAQSPEEGLFWGRILHLGAIPIPVFFMHFSFAILNIIKKNRIYLIAAYIICILLLALVPTPYLLSHTVETVGFKYFCGPAGFHYHLFPIYFFACIIFSLYELIRVYRKSMGIKKTQLKYLIIASLIGYTGGPGGFYPLYNIPIPYHSFYTVSIYLGLIAFAIIRYRLFDIEFILKKSYYFTVFIITSFLVLSGTAFFYSKMAGSPNSTLLTSIIVGASLMLLVIFHYLQPRIEGVAERLLTKKHSDLYDSLEKLRVNITKKTSRDELLEYLCSEIFSKMALTNLSLYSIDKSNKSYNLRLKYPLDAPFPESIDVAHNLIDRIHKYYEIVETDKIKHDLDYSRNVIVNNMLMLLDELKAALVLPVIINNEIHSLLVLGYPLNKIGFMDRELLIIKNIVKQSSLILENMLLTEQIRLNNQNRMELIGTMSASFAHEIRNPLTTIKTLIEMITEKTNDTNFISKFKEIVPKEVNRILDITKHLLDFSKSSAPQYAFVDFNNLLSDVKILLKDETAKHSAEIITEIIGDSTIYADANQLLQVILNMVLNSIQAIKTTGMVKVIVNGGDNISQIIITDNGEGINPNNIHKIFEPFYSSKIYGTGLGLATCKRIIESHRGRISVESEPGKGTTFTISIPKSQSVPKPV